MAVDITLVRWQLLQQHTDKIRAIYKMAASL